MEENHSALIRECSVENLRLLPWEQQVWCASSRKDVAFAPISLQSLCELKSGRHVIFLLFVVEAFRRLSKVELVN